jgi:leucine dehydrogenase
MTYKAAINKLNIGGGKAVIIGDPARLRAKKLFRAFGRFVENLNGRYITVEDVNTDTQCMEWVRSETKHVVGIPRYLGGLGDPSPVTALGTFIGIKAAVKKVMGKDDLKNIKIAIQGVGHVGYHLCKKLYQAGAKIYIADINSKILNNVGAGFKPALTKFPVTVVDPDKIYDLDVDVFSPCAYGAIINDQTIPQLKCKIIAGAANNQLADENKHGLALKKRNILYAPDYIINAGGLINSYAELNHAGKDFVEKKIKAIYVNLRNVFAFAEQENLSTIAASNRIAEQHI